MPVIGRIMMPPCLLMTRLGGGLRFKNFVRENSMIQWSTEKANSWAEKRPWQVGCNFIPSTAINQLEMWQADTFDLETIERELSWAAQISMNSVRTYLHDLAWADDAAGFKERISQFLNIAQRHGISPMFVIFDDCWNPKPKIGPQPAPTPSVHNSGWLQSPGLNIVNGDSSNWRNLEAYVTDILTHFRHDERILMWDLYNEPGNNNNGERSLPFVKAVFKWARAVNPSQPLTVGVWFDNEPLNTFQLANSDIITFHNYHPAAQLKTQIKKLKRYGRPLICTEWLARTHGSLVQTNLPIFHQEQVGCINWGLVDGKTNTKWQWDTLEGSPEPDLWFHELLHPDGTPYDQAEIDLFQQLCRKRV